MCLDTLSSCLIRYHEGRLSSRLSFLFHTLYLSPFSHSLYFFSRLYVFSQRETYLSDSWATFFFFLSVQKRKMIQTMEMSAYHLLVAISSRLPQSQIRPQIKYKTETHAFCIWMLIPCLEIPNCFWQGICRGPSFMYILRFMKFQHMVKVDI